MLQGVVFNQLDSFPLGWVTFQYVNPDIFQPQLIHKAGIAEIASFKLGHLGFS